MRAPLLPLVVFVAVAACGGSSPATDAAAPNDAASVADTGTGPTDAASTPDTGAAPIDTGVSETTYMMPAGDCFTFATATSVDAMSMTCGDMQGLSGANVDLSSPGAGGLCQLTGTYASLASIPSSYASCAWMSYIEGIGGLTNAGFIVRDAASVHHYRMHVLSNAQPALVFSFDMID